MQIQANNTWINYELSGPENAPVVMLSHSLGSSLYMWDPQMPELEKNYRVLRYDIRGHGGSQVESGAYTLERLADDAIALMDDLKFDQVHWVGLSLGGMIGQNLALRYPDRLMSLSLCDTMAALPQEAAPMWQQRITAARDKGMEALVDGTMERWFTAPYLAQDPPALKLIRQYFLKTAVDGFIGCCEAIRGLNHLDQLGEVKLPTFIIVGEQDYGTPVSASEAIHEKIPQSQLVILPEAAHLSNIEQAEAFTKALLKFLDSQ